MEGNGWSPWQIITDNSSVQRDAKPWPGVSSRGGPPAWISSFNNLSTTALIIGFCANILALYIIKRCQKLRDFNSNEVTGTLLNYLLVIDALATATFAARNFSRDWLMTQTFYCDLTYTTSLFFSWCTGFINMLLCVERCLALAAPFWYYSFATALKAHLVALCTVVATLLLCLLPVFGLGSYRKTKNPYSGTYTCISPSDLSQQTSPEIFAFAVIFLIIGIGILLVIHVANTIVVYNVIKISRKNKKIGVIFGAMSETGTSAPSQDAGTGTSTGGNVASSVDDGRAQQKLVNKEIRLAMAIIALSFVFTLAWLPYYVSYL